MAGASRIESATFVALVALVLALRWTQLGSLAQAIGGAVIEIPAALAIGRLALWLVDKVRLFGANVAGAEQRRVEIGRSLWRTLSLSLAIGYPLWLLASRPA